MECGEQAPKNDVNDVVSQIFNSPDVVVDGCDWHRFGLSGRRVPRKRNCFRTGGRDDFNVDDFSGLWDFLLGCDGADSGSEYPISG